MKLNYFLFLFLLSVSSSIAQTEIINHSEAGKAEDEMVYTPFGKTLKSKMHYVDGEHHLNIKDDHIQLMNTKTGVVSHEFDNTVSTQNKTENNRSIIESFNERVASADTENGWVTYSYWIDNGGPINYFSTNWIVPPVPVELSEQRIFLFNSLSPLSGNAIIQPVLQWGISAIGGGNYWAIADWYIAANGDYYTDSLVQVSPGTNLQGVMKLTADSANTYSYNCTFKGYPSLGLQVDNVPDLGVVAAQTLEVYNVSDCSQYPADTLIKMSKIQIQTDSIYPAIAWDTLSLIANYGQHSIVVSNRSDSGEVDLYFHEPCSVAAVINLSADDEIRLYPNPASDNLNINIPQNLILSNINLEILNIEGQLIKTFVVRSNETIVDISDFPRGMYFIKMKTEDSIIVKKFVKE